MAEAVRVGEAAQQRRDGRQRVARDVEAEHLLLALETLAVGPLGGVGERRARRAAPPGAPPNRLVLSDLAVALGAAPASSATSRLANTRARLGVEGIEGAALHQALDHAPVHAPAVDARRRSRTGCGTGPAPARLEDRLDRALADVLDAGEAEADALAHHGEVARALVHRRRQDLDPELMRVRDVARELVVVARLRGEQRRQVLARVVRAR